MIDPMRTRVLGGRPVATRAASAASLLAALCVLASLAGCSSSRDGDARADVNGAGAGTCAATVLDALGHVAARVYEQGVFSERTASARHMIEGSAPLRAAVEAGSASRARAAARALLATGHLTNLRVVRGKQMLADVGGGAVTPLNGTLNDARGAPIATYVTSVWADSGLIAETNGIAEGSTVVRAGERTVAGSFELPDGKLPTAGTLTRDGAAYQYTSYAAKAYPDGAPLRVYVVRSIDSIASLCGADNEATLVNTVSRIARRIYEGEAGRRTLASIKRVQQSTALQDAVAKRDPVATRAAIAVVQQHHIVRLRVSAGTRLLSDVGGPFVLAPVEAPLSRGGRTVGSFVLSIQDDEGYKRLAQRLVGLDVVMYMGSRLVKSTLGGSPGTIPTSGTFTRAGKRYALYTFTAKAFPSGPLRITVLIPIPYS
jgi:hypothetical protein